MTTPPNARPKLTSPPSRSRGDVSSMDETTLRMDADRTNPNWKAIALVLAGIGLGLSVVHQIVTQHGGTVTVTRNEERGTTFSLFFPQSRGDLT